jgi:ABC-type transport system involved in cytochrome c biogenesis permease subunit
MSTLLTPRRPDVVRHGGDQSLAAQLAQKVLFWGYTALLIGAFLWLSWVNFAPFFTPRSDTADAREVRLPALNYEAWHDLPCLHRGRIKPFETACQEIMREITGANHFKKLDSVGVVLAWLTSHRDEGTTKAVWDDVPFILCGHEGVRSLLFRVRPDGTLSDEQPTPEFMEAHFASPNQLRQFREGMAKLRERDLPLFEELYKPIEDKEKEAAGKLFLYEQIVQNLPPPTDDGEYHDPLAFVALDKVAGSPWFSLAELRRLARDPGAWEKILQDRVEQAPQLYLPEECRAALEEFKTRLKRGEGNRTIDELADVVARNRADTVSRWVKLRAANKEREADDLLDKMFRSSLSGETEKSRAQLADKMREVYKAGDTQKIATALTDLLTERDQRVLKQLRERLPQDGDYRPDATRFRMLHLGYLETRFPELYRDAVRWQKFNKDDALAVLGAFNQVQEAYAGGDAGKFDRASEGFFATVQRISEKAGAYPGADTLGDRVTALLTGETVRPPSEGLLNLELTFNKVTPFRWAWVSMLAAVVLFLVSLGLNSRLCYLLAFVAFGVSLAFQLFGFCVRMLISGRPPVTNMYETVVWVALVSAGFALVLELIYRKKIIALAGAIVASIALVLADTLPVVLDPALRPLNPVLRSNFWLTIHVITEVSSYAAGTLAWGLGNISLTMIIFGKGSRETVKMLGQFTYRALQLAVLLLAAGTFLGGWWAAYSWGRFWGWDPKETGALIALVCYVIPLHMRYIGWVKDFGLAVSAIVCYIAVLGSWYGVNFLLGAGLHAYGFGGGGATWVFWAIVLNLLYLNAARLIYLNNLVRLRTPLA